MPGRSPRIPCGECQVAQHARLIRPGTPRCHCGHCRSPSVVECQAGTSRSLPLCVRRTWHTPHHAVGGSAGLAAGLVCGPVGGGAGQRAVRAAADLGGGRAAVGRWAGRRGEGAGGRRPARAVWGSGGPARGAAWCVAAQAGLGERGFPCARPLTPAVGVGSLAVHAEEFRPGGEVLHGDSPDVAVRYAEAFARLMAELADVTVAPPLPNPPWVRWDHTDSGVWPAIDCLDNWDQSVVPAYVVDTAERARGRILAAGLPCVLGHADFEAQNLRWHGQQVWAVHDWDTWGWQPGAARAGAASGSFASAGPPTLAPIESSEAFLVAYQDLRGRLFTAVEQEIAWAASVWMAAYNAREEALHGHTSVGRDALRAQAAERLRRANA